MSTAEKLICRDCITEVFLKSYFFKDKDIGTCSYCKQKERAMSIKEFSEIIYKAINEHFIITSDQQSAFENEMSRETDFNWERKGQQINYLLEEKAGISENVVHDVLEYLSYSYTDCESLKLGEEDPFGHDAHYEESPADQFSMMESWSYLCSEIKSRARFFSPVVESTLDQLFEGLDELKTHNGNPSIRVIEPHEEIFIYRARIAETEKEIEKILLSPVQELGAPPQIYAKPGRMNPIGISVFYGAEDEATCISEIRPPVGSHVVIGKFGVLHPLRLLDLNILSQAFKSHVSVFDPDANETWGRIAFLRHLVSQLTKPIMPSDEVFEYLPTQVVAEYLSEKFKPRIDGIIFKSSQSANEKNNIVLFNHSSITDEYVIPEGTKISVNIGAFTYEEYDLGIGIYEVTPSKKETKEIEEKNILLNAALDLHKATYGQENEETILSFEAPTLWLDINSIEIKRIKSVSYDTYDRSVSRSRSEKNK